MTFKINETVKVDEILAEWNRYIASLKERVSRMRDRLWSEVAHHSAEAHKLGTQANRKLDNFGTRFDEIQSIIVALGPAIIAAMKTEFGNEFRKMEHAIQANEIGAKAQTLLLYGFEELEYGNGQPGGLDALGFSNGRFPLVAIRRVCNLLIKPSNRPELS